MYWKKYLNNNKKSYWRLRNVAKKYSEVRGTEKDALIDLGFSILNTKATRFSFAQILFSIGTLAYSILFVSYEIVPKIIGWFGIIASVIYGFGNVIFHIKHNFKVL